MKRSRHQTCVAFFALLAAGVLAYADPPAMPPGAAGAVAPAPLDPPPTLEVAGLRLVAKEIQAGNQTLRPFNWMPGTTVALLVRRPTGGLIALDRAATHLTKIADNKGTNLMAKDGTRGFSAGIHFVEIAKDSTTALLELRTPHLPATGAKELAVQGVLAFRTATQQKTVEQAGVAVVPGSKIAAGPFNLVLKKVDKIQGVTDKRMEQTITFEAHQDLADIISIEFFDAVGQAIESSEGGTSTTTAADGMTVCRTYNLAQKPDTMAVKITYWADPQSLRIPVNLSLSIGL